MGKENFFQRVYEIVKKIPSGKVMTYGQIALRLRSGQAIKITPRIVGFALHANKDPKIPCHRVVNKVGAVAKNYAFGRGWKEQRMRLQAEGVKFKKEMQVDLEKFLWNPQS
ncbi:hypothetical protein A2955_03010 [Candidatus Woesebacteria bacterium RIFCSPLOWO2_01_FULL_37_19]|uniref:Methylated-DNA-[protein]-cysteine S-methyltransferase DNA binding domain-containing protein n=2 Tax=Candidatus Woeseibacteriota TaxID=1752722 RepID=A0A1F8BBM1_9BACT|nr:MAG: hypothetical protein A2771_00165 [Candidatus Woesebacteria bacterium RIFCSPHIGHO2_01_FULL_38_26b]OGM61431.1 MAG: hypothetical protein A2955_03010 [Candidatus Woesebacteria bacterium RIFCSPLOWO2_01_FULL_37_19]